MIWVDRLLYAIAYYYYYYYLQLLSAHYDHFSHYYQSDMLDHTSLGLPSNDEKTNSALVVHRLIDTLAKKVRTTVQETFATFATYMYMHSHGQNLILSRKFFWSHVKNYIEPMVTFTEWVKIYTTTIMQKYKYMHV